MKNEFDFVGIVGAAMDKLPEDFGKGREELRKNLAALLQAAFARLDLVSREEFDIQSELLARTREKAELLARQVADLEQSAPASHSAED